MDGDGIPLSCEIAPFNTNEQITLKSLEEKILKDFKLSKIVVCTDADLASNTNRKFNNTNTRKFITTQSIKKLKEFLKEEALDLIKEWHLLESDKSYNIEKLRTDETLIEAYKDKTFYKERWIKENGLEQRLIITYSVKYQEHQKNIRNNQIEREIKNKDYKLAGVKQIRIHDFRHSCASLLINSGAAINVVAKYLGHKKIDETLNTYSHLFKNQINEIINIIDNLN